MYDLVKLHVYDLIVALFLNRPFQEVLDKNKW